MMTGKRTQKWCDKKAKLSLGKLEDAQMIIKRGFSLAVVTLVCLWVLPCSAGGLFWDNGEKLREFCAELDRPKEKADYMSGNWCLGFIQGVLDWRHAQSPSPCGQPEGSSSKQVALVVNKYLLEHPEKLHEPAAALVVQAVHQAWCKGNHKK
jgi:hypothetical protein